MQPAYPRQGHYLSRSDGPRFNLTGTRRLFIKSDVRSVFMVIAEVVLAQSHQVSFVQRDHMIKQLAADSAHPSFRDSILPGTALVRTALIPLAFKNLCTSTPNLLSRSKTT